MTIREIAVLSKVGERTIRRWITTLRTKCPGLADKMSGAQKSGTPADFSLDETIAIVRAGGNGTFADLLKDNVTFAKHEGQPLRIGKLEEEIQELKMMVSRLMTGIPSLIASAVQQINSIQMLLPSESETLPSWVRDIAKRAEEKSARRAVARKSEMQLPFSKRGK